MRTSSSLIAFLLAATASVVVGCPSSDQKPSGSVGSGGSTSTSTQSATDQKHLDSRFMKIRSLLEKAPESTERAMKLRPMIEPLCTDAMERERFIDTAKWSASFSTKDVQLTVMLAADTIEHAATVCFRNHSEAALDLLARANEAIPETYRFDLVAARLYAVQGDFDRSLSAARSAKDKGSVHAVALTAKLLARKARNDGVGYRAGMFDEAIAIVSVEPTKDWQLIDLTAVLSTRAHLLSERAIWEPEPHAVATRREARKIYERLSVAPFIEATRRWALDSLCFEKMDTGDDAGEHCKRAATELGILGAAVAVEVDTAGAQFDHIRLQALRKMAETIETLKPSALVVIVVRGDEAEILEWARPAARILARLAEKKARLVLVDRTSDARSAALVRKISELGRSEPVETVDAQRNTHAMPCVAAVLAERRPPKACPLERSAIDRLSRLGRPAFALLVGRDLDAEIDDLRLYEHPVVLLSHRQSRMEKKGLEAWLKSTSDVLVLAPKRAQGAPVP